MCRQKILPKGKKCSFLSNDLQIHSDLERVIKLPVALISILPRDRCQAEGNICLSLYFCFAIVTGIVVNNFRRIVESNLS